MDRRTPLGTETGLDIQHRVELKYTRSRTPSKEATHGIHTRRSHEQERRVALASTTQSALGRVGIRIGPVFGNDATRLFVLHVPVQKAPSASIPIQT
ncbi:MAG: hypothetical protein ACJAZO_003036 [Myxococcota bacterium]